jgi:Zn-dependent protease with chaperone function
VIGPYLLKLLCLCLASFFIVNALSGMALLCVSGVAVKIAEKLRARTAARLLFLARLFPCLLGIAVVIGLCVPSYLRFEPEATVERVGLSCLIAALLGSISWVVACVRGARALVGSQSCRRRWYSSGQQACLPGVIPGALLVQSEFPLLAMIGVIRPRVVVSEAVLRVLSSEQLKLAFDHENAHAASRDNLKRLLLLLAPDPLPFVRAFAALEQKWAKLCEWAADDEAVRGDPCRAVTLAAALVDIARMGISPRLTFLQTSLVNSGQELSDRIDRLLGGMSLGAKQNTRSRALKTFTGLGSAACLASVAACPAILSFVHRLLELLLR